MYKTLAKFREGQNVVQTFERIFEDPNRIFDRNFTKPREISPERFSKPREILRNFASVETIGIRYFDETDSERWQWVSQGALLLLPFIQLALPPTLTDLNYKNSILSFLKYPIDRHVGLTLENCLGGLDILLQH